MIMLNVNHRGAVQSAHMLNLISAFDSRSLESILAELDTYKFHSSSHSLQLNRPPRL